MLLLAASELVKRISDIKIIRATKQILIGRLIFRSLLLSGWETI